MIKAKRDLIKLAESLGLEDIRVGLTGGGHLHLTATYKGHPVQTHASLSGSCVHATHNNRASLRRQMRDAK